MDEEELGLVAAGSRCLADIDRLVEVSDQFKETAPMLKDIHPELGPRTRVSSLEEALARARDFWPRASMEGSTGFQRSFWVAGELVGHCWEVRGRDDDFWLRVRAG